MDNENLEVDGIMNVDLNQLESGKYSNKLIFWFTELNFIFNYVVRPKNKNNLESTLRRIQELELREHESNENRLLAIREDEDGDDEDLLKLGQYEYKTLSLHGYRKPIIKPATPTAEEVRAFNFKGDEWPITQSMLYEALKFESNQDE